MKKPRTIKGWNEFNKYYDKFEGDKKQLASQYDVALSTIYKWLKEKECITYDVPNEERIDEVEFDRLHKEAIEKTNELEAYKINVNIKKPCLIVCMSDFHIGNKHTRYEQLKKDTKLIGKTDNVYALFNGDLLDCPTLDAPKDLISEQLWADPRKSKAYAKGIIENMDGSIITMVSGCHDDWEEFPYILSLKKYTITNTIVRDAIHINMKVGDHSYKWFMSHKMKYGSIGSRTYTGFMNERRKVDADIVFDAHRHDPGIGVQFNKMKKIVAVSGGTYKKLDRYAKKNGYTPIPFSIPALYLGTEGEMVPFMNWRDGLCYITGKK